VNIVRMKRPEVKLEMICQICGKTRQAFYLQRSEDSKTSIAYMIVLALVGEIRKDIPRIGGRKLHHMLTLEFEKHHIKIGRDQLFDLLRVHGLLIRRRKRAVKTTDSFHWLRKYKNLSAFVNLSSPGQLWVADITYIKTSQGYSYLSLITDAYSRKIVGYALHPTLEAVGCLKALKMALEGKGKQLERLVHHSDRGIQYCCSSYVGMLIKEGVDISMTENGSPYDNALAERMNNTIKNDYTPERIFLNHNEASQHFERVIHSYNNRRPHQSLNYLTPSQAHVMEGTIEKKWKKYPRKAKNAMQGNQD
jgi:putative transposase